MKILNHSHVFSSAFLFFMGTSIACEAVYAEEVKALRAQVELLMRRVNQLEGRLEQVTRASKTSEPVALKTAAIKNATPAPTPLESQNESTILAHIPKKVKSGNDKVQVSLSGQLNRAVLWADNDQNSKIFHVENDVAPSRFRIDGTGKYSEDLTLGTTIETQIRSNGTDEIDIGTQLSGNQNVTFTERKIEIYADSKKFGKLWIGQGDVASAYTNEVDLSGTSNVGAGATVEDVQGGVTFRDRNIPSLKGPKVINAWDGMDGVVRADRIRYDTPPFQGFTASISHTDGDSGDGAINFAGEFGKTQVQAAVSAGKKRGVYDQYNGSASVLFSSGISVGGALGTRDGKRPKAFNASLAHGKLGYQFKWFNTGVTAFAVDYGQMRKTTAAHDKITTYSFMAVQNLDEVAAEVYFTLRCFDLKRPGNNFGQVKAAMFGALVKF
ncbi:MAG: porin [Alphaproteobacteria bacterium]|nr:porin [Alphaproteobacteria bacterium]